MHVHQTVGSPNSITIKNNVIKLENGMNSRIQVCCQHTQGVVMAAPWLPLMYLAPVSLQYACSTTPTCNSAKKFIYFILFYFRSGVVSAQLALRGSAPG